MCLVVNSAKAKTFLGSFKTCTTVYKCIVECSGELFTPYEKTRIIPNRWLYPRFWFFKYKITRQNEQKFILLGEVEDGDILKEGGIHVYLDKKTGIEDKKWIKTVSPMGYNIHLVKCYIKKDDFIAAGVDNDGMFKRVFIPFKIEKNTIARSLVI